MNKEVEFLLQMTSPEAFWDSDFFFFPQHQEFKILSTEVDTVLKSGKKILY